MGKRLLFCLPTTALSGGVKVILELANRLVERGVDVDIFSFAGEPLWFQLKCQVIPQKNIADIPYSDYDFVFVCNAFMVPLVLPHLNGARGVFFCQDYESFHHAHSTNFDDFMADDPSFTEIYRLPMPIVTVSTAVQALILSRIGKESSYVPVGINKQLFRPHPPRVACSPKRILMVGNYLMPYKGMPDGFAAIGQLSQEMQVELVLVTQENRNRNILAALKFLVEVHNCPREEDMPGIMASCDVYCCASWYEGLGLPGLEAFHCGVPVVSTRDFGVSEYGSDGFNLLLAAPNNPGDLAHALRRVLTDADLAGRLRAGGLDTVADRYDWDYSVLALLETLDEIERAYVAPDVDPDAMAGIIRRLDLEGNLTPIDAFRRFRELSALLDMLVAEMASGPHPSEIQKACQLREIAEELREYTRNPRSEYYKAFMSKYDLARLVLGHVDTPRLADCLVALVRRKEHGTVLYPETFRELEYSSGSMRRKIPST